MKHDLLRFTIVFIVSLFIGIMVDMTSLCVIIGLCLFIFSQFCELSNLYQWLQHRQDIAGTTQAGLIDDIGREIEKSRNRHRAREAKLINYLKRFQEATSALPDAVVVLGTNGEIEWANKNAKTYLGVKWPQDSAVRITNLLRTPVLNRYLNAGPAENNKGLQLLAPTNNQMILEVRVTDYGDTQQLMVARDVTSIVRANQMRKDFIANASHELRTPLTVISGYLESFADDDLCPVEWLTYIRQMRTQTCRMQNLIEDLLQLSSLEASNSQQRKEIVRVPDMLNSILSEAKSLGGEIQHQLTLEAEPDLYIFGNHYQLYSAFSNLVFNAVQYTPAKGRIKLSWFRDDQGAHMLVEDNGLGIATEHIARLTERFYRIDKGRSREKGGTGLGLAIVKHVLANHGGQLIIESSIGEGSRFQCDLPRTVIASAQVGIGKFVSA